MNIKYKIKDLVIANYGFLQLFQKYQIDFYSDGELILEEILNNSVSFDKDLFMVEFNKLNSLPPQKYGVDIEKWSLDLLIDYIQKVHHKYTDRILVEIKSAIQHFLENENASEVKEIIEKIKPLVEELAGELGAHMKREELLLFPKIKKLVMARGKIENSAMHHVENPIGNMIHEHDTQKKIITQIREITNYYSWSQQSAYDSIISLLHQLDLDLEHHIHLENNILFPKAVELEKQLTN